MYDDEDLFMLGAEYNFIYNNKKIIIIKDIFGQDQLCIKKCIRSSR